jgi:hypothetical protein
MTIPCVRLVSALLLALSLLSAVFAHAQAVSQQAELTSSPGFAREKFGWSVAIGGNALVVGAPHQAEAAFVFTNSGGEWTQAAGLVGTNTGTGLSVAISSDGKTVAAGNERNVLVFVEPPTGWTNMTQTAELSPTGSAFGASVAVSADGNIIAVGGIGEALVYEEPAGGWAGTVEPAASLATPPGAERFGTSIAIDGDTVVVGDPDLNLGVGAAYVYLLRRGPHKIPVSATLTASDGGGMLGYSVAVSGDTVVAGAFGHNSYVGAAYVFVEPLDGWTDTTQTAELTVDATSQTDVGFSVALAGNTILAGAPTATGQNGQNENQGAAFANLRPADGWVNTSTPNVLVTGSDSAANDQFGWSVSLSGTTAVIGAPFHAVNGNAEQGAAYVFGEQ